jgi:hypothetical protein
MAEWKKIIVSGSGLSQLDNDSGYLTSFGSVTQHNDVTNAGSGKIITDTERTTLGTALQSLGSVTGHTDVSNAGSGKIITDTERTTLGTALQSLGSVTGHTDVASAGSGRIITDAERAAIGALNNFTGSLNANFATDAELAAVSGALASDISAIDRAVPAITSNGSTPSLNSGISKAEIQSLLNVADGAQVNVGTNITVVEGTTTVAINSSTGTDDSIAAATTTKAGVMTAADKDKLDKIEDGAQVNVGTNITVVEGTSTVAINSNTGNDDSIAAATTTAAGVMTAADKVKLNSIDTDANDYTLTIADVKAVLGGGMPSNALSIGDANDIITIGNDLVVTGDLTVSGDTTSLNVTNLDVEDQFINIAKGIGEKEGGIDGGIVIEGQQTAFGWDESADRWAFDYAGATKDQTSIASDAFAVTVHKPAFDEAGRVTPDTNYEKDGNIYIAPKTGDIFIYVE